MCKFHLFADFSGKGLKEGGAVLGSDDVLMQEFDSYSTALAAAAVAYAMGANDVAAVVFFPKPRCIEELSKQLDSQKVEGGHMAAN